jgi:hypothetical protein
MLDDPAYEVIYKELYQTCFGKAKADEMILKEKIFTCKINLLAEMLGTSQFSSNDNQIDDILKNTLIAMEKIKI